MEKNLTHIALFAALIAVLGLVPKIDLAAGVPITAQSMGIMLCGTVLGAKRGALAVLLFLAVGLIVPVFPGFMTLLQKIQSPSIGYIIGFPIAAFVTGLIMQNAKLAVFPAAFIGAILGCIVVLYAFGIPGMAFMLDKPLSEMAIAAAVFLPGDLIKATLAALLTRAIAQMRPEALLSRG